MIEHAYALFCILKLCVVYMREEPVMQNSIVTG